MSKFVKLLQKIYILLVKEAIERIEKDEAEKDD